MPCLVVVLSLENLLWANFWSLSMWRFIWESSGWNWTLSTDYQSFVHTALKRYGTERNEDELVETSWTYHVHLAITGMDIGNAWRTGENIQNIKKILRERDLDLTSLWISSVSSKRTHYSAPSTYHFYTPFPSPLDVAPLRFNKPHGGHCEAATEHEQPPHWNMKWSWIAIAAWK